MSNNSDSVRVPFIVEWVKSFPNGDTNMLKSGTFEFNAVGWDYDSVTSYAIHRAVKACKRHSCQMISVTMKGTYDIESNTIKTWSRKLIKFPSLSSDIKFFK